MSKKKAIIVIVIVLAILITGTLFLFPLNGEDSFQIGNTNYDFTWVSKSIKLGLDLEGGMYAIYEADLEGMSADEADSAMSGTIANLETLLFSKGYTEAVVTRQGENQIRVEIPAVSDTSKLMELIGEPAKLEFKDSSGNVLIEGTKHLDEATAVYYEGSYAISLKFNTDGTTAFATATSDNIGKEISIYINDKEVISPTVNAAITDGNAIITGNYTYSKANDLATQINAGTFDVQLKNTQSNTISATLGDNPMLYVLIAAAIGIGIIIILLLILYRGFGLLASFSLLTYTVLLVWLLAIVPWVQLTLPGVAGVIISIGMAVDANIIIFERIKEEKRVSNKSIASSVKGGFKKSLSAIIDGNVTTIIGAIVMIIFGATSIQSFAITLLIGILLSMFCSLFVTRLFINLALAFNDQNEAFYGLVIKEETK